VKSHPLNHRSPVFVILGFIAFCSLAAQGEECQTAEFKWRRNRVEQTKQLEVCIDHRLVLDKKCYQSGGECEAFKAYDSRMLEIPSAYGRKEHWHCHRQQGVPKIGALKIKGQWEPVALCFFKDNSFISVDSFR
jgi:hypothetical protein